MSILLCGQNKCAVGIVQSKKNKKFFSGSQKYIETIL